MSLLDGGIQALFGQVFGAIYLDGVLHVATEAESDTGGLTVTFSDQPIKGMPDQWNQSYEQQYGIPRVDAVLIVLQLGVIGAPTPRSQVTLRGIRYAISHISEDPAQAAWVFGASPVP